MASKKVSNRAIKALMASFPGLFKEDFVPVWEEAMRGTGDPQIQASIDYLLTKYTSAYLPTPGQFLAFGARAAVDESAGLGPEWFGEIVKDEFGREIVTRLEQPRAIESGGTLTKEELRAKFARVNRAVKSFGTIRKAVEDSRK